MTGKAKQWENTVADLFAREGLHDFEWRQTGGGHRRACGKLTIQGGRVVTITVLVSQTPTSGITKHQVRNNLRAAIRNARRTQHAEA